MNFFRSMLSIVALCAIGSVNAKGLKKGETPTTTPSTQPQPKPITNQPAQPKPIVKSQQPAQHASNYNELCTTIDKIEPSADNFPILLKISSTVGAKFWPSFADFETKLTLPLSNDMRTLMNSNWEIFLAHPQHLSSALSEVKKKNPSEYNTLLQEKTPLGQKIRSFLEEQSTSI